ncbi:hypothetical protein N9A58_02330 [Opitutales bacterium]|nr:hypothetical protein [Opitutales bacterium]
MARRKKALVEAAPKKTSTKVKPVKAKKVAKSVPKRPASKEEPTAAEAEVKASDKATTADVLGPDSKAAKTPATTVEQTDTPASSEE